MTVPPGVPSPLALPPRFPFSAVVGAEDVKLALLLVATLPALGGVLLRGDKGSAKSTLARGLAGVLGPDVPFVDLPLGATEERVVGSLDLAAAFAGGEVRLQPGLLAEAHGGVLYVDEVNLLADHLVDVLLDVAASGVNRVERDGISHSHEARFLLVGSMNAEEGELRPQLLDRFGLAVDVRNPTDPAARVEIVRRRSAYDADPVAFVDRWAEAEAAVAVALAEARSRLAVVPDDVLLSASELCVSAGAESLRADLGLSRAAAAHAAWQGRGAATGSDLRAVAHLVLTHRQRRHPLDDPGAGAEAMQDALDDIVGPSEGEPEPRLEPEAGSGPGSASQGAGTPADAGPDDRADGSVDDGAAGAGAGASSAAAAGAGPGDGALPAAESRQEPGALRDVLPLAAPRVIQPAAGGRRSPVEAPRGRSVGDRVPQGTVGAVAVVATLRAAASRLSRTAGHDPGACGGSGGAGGSAFGPGDLREPVRESRTGNLLVLAVDASSSMNAEQRMAEVKGALLGLLLDAYQRRDRVALVTFGGQGAVVVLRPTGSIEVARTRLTELRTGGDTPLAEGIRLAADLAVRSASPTLRPLLVVVTDGRATAGPDPWAAARVAAAGVRQARLPAVVVDVEEATTRLGLAGELAAVMGARHLPLPVFTAGRLQSALRGGASGGWAAASDVAGG